MDLSSLLSQLKELQAQAEDVAAEHVRELRQEARNFLQHKRDTIKEEQQKHEQAHATSLSVRTACPIFSISYMCIP